MGAVGWLRHCACLGVVLGLACLGGTRQWLHLSTKEHLSALDCSVFSAMRIDVRDTTTCGEHQRTKSWVMGQEGMTGTACFRCE
jgi:hypothetical protein